ncbi:MAG: hypothetical protein LBB30_04850 [Candidatus Methanoplasma sp.]|jgi:hypothetical protein|nr:hypothetical protein [Candidatus Methanoplasma sp.]
MFAFCLFKTFSFGDPAARPNPRRPGSDLQINEHMNLNAIKRETDNILTDAIRINAPSNNKKRSENNMPIESFYEMLVIDTPEKAAKLVEAFEAAERRGPYIPEHDIMKILEESDKSLEKFVEEYKAARKRGNPPTHSTETRCSDATNPAGSLLQAKTITTL